MKLNFLLLVILKLSMANIMVTAQEYRFVEIQDGQLGFRTYGSGDSLLIINGSPGNGSDDNIFLAKKLSKHFQTIIFDYRGTGASYINKIDSNSITFEKMVTDIEKVRIGLGVKKWNVLGHWFGGLIATQYASKYPENIKRLILSSTGGVNLEYLKQINLKINENLTQIERDSLRAIENKLTCGTISEFESKQRAKYLAKAYVFYSKFVDKVSEDIFNIDCEINSLLIKNLIQIKYDCSNQFENFYKQTLIIHPKQGIIDKQITLKNYKIFKKSKIQYIEKCGHYPWLDNPDEFFRAIIEFLK